MMVWHVLLLLVGLGHNYSMPTSSMQPTIMRGSLFEMQATRLYGLLPFGLSRPFQPGDVIVFYNRPTGELYIKRVVAIAGDRVQMWEGRLYINGEVVSRTVVRTAEDMDSLNTVVPVTVYTETLPNGYAHLINEIGDDQPLDSTDEYVVPDGHLFALGDNRDRSADSRVLSQVGYVPVEDVVAFSRKDDALFYWWHGR